MAREEYTSFVISASPSAKSGGMIDHTPVLIRSNPSIYVPFSQAARIRAEVVHTDARANTQRCALVYGTSSATGTKLHAILSANPRERYARLGERAASPMRGFKRKQAPKGAFAMPAIGVRNDYRTKLANQRATGMSQSTKITAKGQRWALLTATYSRMKAVGQ